MPIIEFKCPLLHVTERILSRKEADTLTHVRCERMLRRGRCDFVAKRVDISSTGKPILKGGGAGGFYAPST